jgi:hypothetical protein
VGVVVGAAVGEAVPSSAAYEEEEWFVKEWFVKCDSFKTVIKLGGSIGTPMTASEPEGALVGDAEGAAVGAPDGTVVGVAVGAAVGEADGKSVGEAVVGEAVGEAVGMAEGENDGATVAVGTAVVPPWVLGIWQVARAHPIRLFCASKTT